MWNPDARAVAERTSGRPQPAALTGPSLVDTAVWTWARDRRYPALAEWFNAEVRSGRVLVCDLIILELLRLTPNEARARALAERLDAFELVPSTASLWSRARGVQLAMAASGDHRRVPPADLVIAVIAESADVPLVHYDRDYERIATVTRQQHSWFVPDGTLAQVG
jgi:predicted nucleic acid-binding protein